VAYDVVLDTEIPLPFDAVAGMSQCPGIGLRVCFDDLIAKLVELLHITDRASALASGPTEM
jgi:hypothetical protein